MSSRTKDATDLQLGRRIRELRRQAGLTQTELATRAGFTFRTISNIETGRSPASFSQALRLAQALDTTLLILSEPPALESTARVPRRRLHSGLTPLTAHLPAISATRHASLATKNGGTIRPHPP